MEIYSEVFLLEKQAPLPVFVEPALSPFNNNAKADFPLVLTSAKVVQFTHGQQRDIPSLRKRSEQPEVTLHPETALARSISEGDEVELKTESGSARMLARFDDTLHPNVVWAQYGWWQSNDALNLSGYNPLSSEGANFNGTIKDDVVDPVSGSVGLRSSLCEVLSLNVSNEKAWKGWRKFIIKEVVEESIDVLSFYLEPDDGRQLPKFLPGQHITVNLIKQGGGSLVRCYTISSGPLDNYYRISVKCALSIKNNINSMSSSIHGCKTGEYLLLQAPSGHFHIGNAGEDAHIILVAGGIGITPIISMLLHLSEERNNHRITMFYGVRKSDEHAFKSSISKIKKSLPNLNVITYYSAPYANDKLGLDFDVKGRITADVIKKHMDKTSEIFICGPGAMVNSVTEGLKLLGVESHRIHMETFGPSSVITMVPVNAKPQTIKFTRSGGEFIWVPGKGSLLDQLDKLGIASASGCRAGQCESCMLSLKSGKVAHPSGSASVRDDHCLPCVCIPLSSLEIDI
ncbi:TPA: 2Fe-2S iron-sulfur cluster binding domain-containing protein [Klebsiella pneumoniae]|nr:2Fe-2S iron-sulfur cluster binding domain-containing protein [Klebsiella pneumoniae]HDK6925103.1 2Fe-2S iron-sulfur cluster binding domain-containing protein [Klebsiella pneumoniae]